MDAEKSRQWDKYGILLGLIAACVVTMMLMLVPAEQGGDYGDFLDKLGMRESSND